MITEPVTGISFPPPEPKASAEAKLGVSLLQRIAGSTATHLQQGGYLADTETQQLLDDYGSHLVSSSFTHDRTSRDFLVFLADRQAQKHSVSPDDEVTRMQRLLWRRLNDRVHYWSLGPLPQGCDHSLYEQCPSLKVACGILLCPAIFAAEDSIIHVAALNPLAGMVAAEWICHDAALSGLSDEPFVFTFLVDFASWDTLQKLHFDS